MTYQSEYSISVHAYLGNTDDIMNLLLIGDESETMIARYIQSCKVYVGLLCDEIVAVCAVMPECDGLIEIKNLAVRHDMQRHGIGHSMLHFVETLYPGKTIILGTGETPSTLRFYKSCGYHTSHKIPGFFTENYPFPIIEEGVRLRDMVYLAKHIPPQQS